MKCGEAVPVWRQYKPISGKLLDYLIRAHLAFVGRRQDSYQSKRKDIFLSKRPSHFALILFSLRQFNTSVHALDSK